MFTALRAFAKSFVFKLLLIPLLGGFALWGVGDVLSFQNADDVLEVDGETVSINEFHRAFESLRSYEQRRTGQYLSVPVAREQNLHLRAVTSLVDQALLDAMTQRLLIFPNDDLVLNDLKNDPNFQNQEGEFTPSLLRSYIAAQNASQEEFLNVRRRAFARRQLITPLLTPPPDPPLLASLFHQWINEARVAEYAVLKPSSIPPPQIPTDQQLQSLLDENPDLFTLPETRGVDVVVLNENALVAASSIADDELLQLWKARARNPYETPEKRRVRQVIFPSSKDADDARRLILNGDASLQNVAQQLNLSWDDADLGTIAKNQFADPIIADAAFSIQPNSLSRVVQSSFGPALLLVTHVEPALSPSFQDVKNQFRKDVLASRAADELFKIYNRIEDLRASGEPLQNIAQTLDLTLIQSFHVAQNGAGLPAPLLNAQNVPQLLNELFLASPGQELQPDSLKDGSYFWADAGEITPEQLPELNRARDAVASVFLARDIQRRLLQLADKIVQDAKSQSLQDALALHAVHDVSKPLTRTKSEPPFSSDALNLLFSLPDTSSVARILLPADNPNSPPSVLVMRAKSITPPDNDPKTSQQSIDNLSQSLSSLYVGAVFQQFIASLRQKNPPEINDYALSNYFSQR